LPPSGGKRRGGSPPPGTLLRLSEPAPASRDGRLHCGCCRQRQAGMPWRTLQPGLASPNGPQGRSGASEPQNAPSGRQGSSHRGTRTSGGGRRQATAGRVQHSHPRGGSAAKVEALCQRRCVRGTRTRVRSARRADAPLSRRAVETSSQVCFFGGRVRARSCMHDKDPPAVRSPFAATHAGFQGPRAE
jgi:hypothetical protein